MFLFRLNLKLNLGAEPIRQFMEQGHLLSTHVKKKWLLFVCIIFMLISS